MSALGETDYCLTKEEELPRIDPPDRKTVHSTCNIVVLKEEILPADHLEACESLRFAVGHYIKECSKDVIMKFPTSRLAKLIGQESDYVSIKRNGRHFGTILNYMRDPSSFVARRFDKAELEEIRVEAEYYRLDKLSEMCGKQMKSMVPFGDWLVLILMDDKQILKNLRRPVVVVDFRTIQFVAKEITMAKFVQAFDYRRYDVLALRSSTRFDYGKQPKNSRHSWFGMQLYEPCDEQDDQMLEPKKPSLEAVETFTGLVEFRILLVSFLLDVDVHFRSKKLGVDLEESVHCFNMYAPIADK